MMILSVEKRQWALRLVGATICHLVVLQVQKVQGLSGFSISDNLKIGRVSGEQCSPVLENGNFLKGR